MFRAAFRFAYIVGRDCIQKHKPPWRALHCGDFVAGALPVVIVAAFTGSISGVSADLGILLRADTESMHGCGEVMLALLGRDCPVRVHDLGPIHCYGDSLGVRISTLLR